MWKNICYSKIRIFLLPELFRHRAGNIDDSVDLNEIKLGKKNCVWNFSKFWNELFSHPSGFDDVPFFIGDLKVEVKLPEGEGLDDVSEKDDKRFGVAVEVRARLRSQEMSENFEKFGWIFKNDG